MFLNYKEVPEPFLKGQVKYVYLLEPFLPVTA